MKNMTNDIMVLASVVKCPYYKPAAIRELMKKLDMNEKGFAVLMNVTVETVRLWTSGVVKPCSTAMRLMQMLDEFLKVINADSSEEEDTFA